MEAKPPYSVIGTPFSTFTRTITMGLQHKGLKYTQISTPPQTETAFSGHPFGYLPTLIIHREHEGTGKADIKLRESQAIVRYIDRLAPEPPLHLQMWKDVVEVEEKMWEFVSLAASFGMHLRYSNIRQLTFVTQDFP
jgi:glutathione S-transferase